MKAFLRSIFVLPMWFLASCSNNAPPSVNVPPAVTCKMTTIGQQAQFGKQVTLSQVPAGFVPLYAEVTFASGSQTLVLIDHTGETNHFATPLDPDQLWSTQTATLNVKDENGKTAGCAPLQLQITGVPQNIRVAAADATTKLVTRLSAELTAEAQTAGTTPQNIMTNPSLAAQYPMLAMKTALLLDPQNPSSLASLMADPALTGSSRELLDLTVYLAFSPTPSLATLAYSGFSCKVDLLFKADIPNGPALAACLQGQRDAELGNVVGTTLAQMLDYVTPVLVLASNVGSPVVLGTVKALSTIFQYYAVVKAAQASSLPEIISLKSFELSDTKLFIPSGQGRWSKVIVAVNPSEGFDFTAFITKQLLRFKADALNKLIKVSDSPNWVKDITQAVIKLNSALINDSIASVETKYGVLSIPPHEYPDVNITTFTDGYQSYVTDGRLTTSDTDQTYRVTPGSTAGTTRLGLKIKPEVLFSQGSKEKSIDVVSVSQFTGKFSKTDTFGGNSGCSFDTDAVVNIDGSITVKVTDDVVSVTLVRHHIASFCNNLFDGPPLTYYFKGKTVKTTNGFTFDVSVDIPAGYRYIQITGVSNGEFIDANYVERNPFPGAPQSWNFPVKLSAF